MFPPLPTDPSRADAHSCRYATETFGVKAIAAHVATKFRVPWEFFDHPTGL